MTMIVKRRSRHSGKWRFLFLEILLTFVRARVNILVRAKVGEGMSPRTGRPTSNKKTERLEIRLAPNEVEDIQYCADKLGISKTAVINKGVQLVKAELDKK